MKRLWTFVALGLLAGLSVASPQTRADQPPVVSTTYNQNVVISQPAGAYCASCAGAQVTVGAAAPGTPKKGAFEKMKGFFGGPSCGCLANTDISCSNCKQEYQFIFGSCRNFFGCPCFKTPEQLMSISEGEYLGRTNPGLNRINRTYP